jgi:hypothetical protein
MSRGLKPNLLPTLNVQAKAWTYLRNKNNSNGKGNGKGKGKYGFFAVLRMTSAEVWSISLAGEDGSAVDVEDFAGDEAGEWGA